MNATEVLDIIRDAMWVMVKIGGPAMILSLIIGIVVSIFQALTQIQEATLAFLPKMVIVVGLIVMMMPFMLGTLVAFTHVLSDRIIGLEADGLAAPVQGGSGGRTGG
jgi:flagellar biosynthetic protein FliQ